MAWPYIFAHSDNANTRRAWGHTFQWTDLHSSLEQMHPLKYSYDYLADECLEILDQIDHRAPETALDSTAKPGPEVPLVEKRVEEKAPRPKRDLFVSLRDKAKENPRLAQLWEQVNSVPTWVDWEQIERGQEVFYRYGGPNLTGLAYQSLLGGMGANRVVETLARTGGFSTKVAKRRIYETTQHILQCTMSLDHIKPGGAGHISSVRVRLLHSAVRRRILALAKQRPGYFNTAEWGIPISDLDSIATIVSFSASLIWISLPRQGIYLRAQEIEDYMALWRLIAYYMGTPTDHFETPAKSKAMMQSLMMFEINPSETSKVLANNVLASLESQPPGFASRDFLTAGARWLNGHELSDALGLGRPSLWYTTLVAGQCIFFMSLCYTYRTIPSWDHRKNDRLRKLFYDLILHKDHGLGEEATYEFKYIPSFYTSTEKGTSDLNSKGQSNVEKRNLKALLIAILFIFITFIVLSRIVRFLLALVR